MSLSVSKNNYQAFINGLNYKSDSEIDDPIANKDAVVVHVSLMARAMSPTEAKEVIDQLISEGIIRKKSNGYLDMTSIYDPKERRFVMMGKAGKKLKTKPGTTGVRTVRYVGPGHTQVNYASRILDIRFKETQEEFLKKQTARRRKAAKLAAKNRNSDDLYLDRDEYGNAVMVTKTGRKADLKGKSRTDKGKKSIVKANLRKDAYTIEDMRALLADDHWEEVCGNRRWNYDKAATVREFNKYLKRKGKA